MANISRRKWFQKSLLASSAILTGGIPSAQGIPCIHENVNLEYLPLNANENPYGPSEKAKEAVMEALQIANRYPFESIQKLKTKLAERFKLKPSNFMLTAGSTEVLSLLGQHVGLQKGEILSPDPSFPTLMRFGERCGAKIRKVSMHGKKRIDLNLLLDEISENTTLVNVVNPNNPTSTEVDPDELREFCRKVPSNVLICADEAYIEFSKKGTASSVMDLVNELPNLIVCRTFSKAYGLAGLRIGYAVSSEENIQAIRSRHTGWEMSAGIAPVAAATAALDDQDFITSYILRNQQGRNIVYRAFDKWGVEYYPSSTNFIYAKTTRFGEDIQRKLRKDKIAVSKWQGIMDGHFRISISEMNHMHQFVDTVEKYLI